MKYTVYIVSTLYVLVILSFSLTVQADYKPMKGNKKPEYELKKDFRTCKWQLMQACDSFGLCGYDGGKGATEALHECMEGNGWKYVD